MDFVQPISASEPLVPGAEGNRVAELQRRLSYLGLYQGKSTSDTVTLHKLRHYSATELIRAAVDDVSTVPGGSGKPTVGPRWPTTRRGCGRPISGPAAS